MPSTYTLNNGIELIGTGEQSGTWGDTTNTNLELLDTALDGQVTITASSAGSSGSPNSLPISDGSASNGRNRMVIITSATDLGSTVYYQLTPNDAEKIIYIRNDLNAQDLIVFQGTYNSSNDYVVPNGTTAVIYFNGAGAGAVAANVLSTLQVDALNVESAASTTAITIDNTATDGDPILGFALSGTNTFTMGVDDGDSDKFKIGTTAIGTNTRLSIDSSGDVEIPSGSLTITSANALTLRNDTATDADEPKITFDNDTFAGANYANIRTGNGGLLLKIESPSTSTFQNRHQLVFNGGSGDDFQYNLSTDNGSNYVNYFKIDGGNVVFNETGANKDFRIESTNSTHMLFVDASEDAIGIRKNDPTYGLDVGVPMRVITADNSTQLTLESTDADASGGPIFTLYRNSSSPAANDFIGKVRFEGRNNNSQSFIAAEILTKIQDVADGAEDGDLRIYTMGNGTSRNRLAFYTDNTVFNDDSIDVDFRVESNNNANMLFVDAGSDHVSIGTGEDRGGVLNVESSDNNYTVMLSCTDDDNNAGPWLGFDRRTGSAADNDTIGSIAFLGRNSAAEQTSYCEIRNVTTDVTNGTEDGQMQFNIISGGSFRNFLHLTGSAQAVFNEDSHDIDFRVESDNQAYAFFVDAGTGGIRSDVYDFTINNQDDGPALTLMSGRDYNSLLMGAAENYGSNNSSSNKWSWNWRGRNAGSTQHYNFLYDEIGNQEYFRVQADASQKAVVVNDGSNDIDFRVESDGNANMLFLDASANKIGIGSSSFNYGTALTVHGNEDAGTPSSVFLRNSGTSGGSGNRIECGYVTGYGAAIRFSGNPSSYRMYGTYFERITGDGPTYATSGEFGTTGIFKTYEGVVHNENGGDKDFRVESDSNTNMLKVDAGNNAVGIGTGSPSSSYGLHVEGSKRAVLMKKTSSGDGDIMQEITWDTSGYAYKVFVGSSGFGYSTNNAVMWVPRSNSTSRSINASGTINASGADYAEYMVKADTSATINKGDVCGIDANGNLTTVWADAISFVVKSTDPSYVGGDTWFNGENPPEDDAPQSEKDDYEARKEAARATVDRIAFSGQVPVNVTGATVGDFIIPVQDGTNITGQAVSTPTFDQYMAAVGKVIAIEDDGRAKIIVKVA